MKGSLTAVLASYFGLLAIGWEGAGVQAVPAFQHLAQATTGTLSNRPTLRVGSEGTAVSELQAALKLLGYYTGVVNGVYNESTVIAVSRFQQAAGLNPDGVVGSGTWELLFPPTPSPVSSQPASPNSAAAFPIPSARATPAPTRSTPRTNTVTAPPTPTSRTQLPSTSRSNQAQSDRSRSNQSRSDRAQSNQSRSNRSRSNQAQSNQSRSNRSRSNPPSTSGEYPILRLGARGSTVSRLQQRLQAAGLYAGSVDGNFGADTETAVKAAQQRYNLAPDGVVGPATWKALNRPRPRSRPNTRDRS